MAAEVPNAQGCALFEVYEKDGSLLLVTSDRTTFPPLRKGDKVVRRTWSTFGGAEFIQEVR